MATATEDQLAARELTTTYGGGSSTLSTAGQAGSPSTFPVLLYQDKPALIPTSSPTLLPPKDPTAAPASGGCKTCTHGAPAGANVPSAAGAGGFVFPPGVNGFAPLGAADAAALAPMASGDGGFFAMLMAPEGRDVRALALLLILLALTERR